LVSGEYELLFKDWQVALRKGGEEPEATMGI
jgi:hypothetical protein